MCARCVLLIVSLLGASCVGPGRAPAKPVDADEAIPLQLPEGVSPVHYAVRLTLDPAADRFRGTSTVDVDLAAPTRAIWLHGRDLVIESSTFEGPGDTRGSAAFTQVSRDGVAHLTFPRTIGPGRTRISFSWQGRYADDAQAGLYRWRGGADTYVLAEFLSIDARRALPSFDEPRFKTPFDVVLTVPRSMTALSNEVALEESAHGDLKDVRFATTRPLPTYLLFFAAGPFDVLERRLPPSGVRSSTLLQRGLAPRGRARDLAEVLNAASSLVGELERWFDYPFPYGKLDHVAAGDYPGAKENAGAILYGADQVLASPEQADDERRHAIARIVAHEAAHQWFGDLVTAPWFTDLWLNEAFTELLAQRITSGDLPDASADPERLIDLDKVMASDGLASARAIARPVRSFDEIRDQLDGFTYDKGVAVLAMFEGWIGRDRFRDALRTYVRVHAHGAGSRSDLLDALSTVAGRDVAGPLLGFIEKPGIPLVRARVTCEHGRGLVSLRQQRYRPRASSAGEDAWTVPVCMRFEVDGTAQERCELLGPGGADVELPGCPTWLLPDSGGRGYYRWALDAIAQRGLLARGLARLGAAERSSIARNARAAQRAGLIPYGDAMDTLASFARDPAPGVFTVGMDAVRDARDHLLDRADQPLAERVARKLYGPLLVGNGFDAPPGEDAPARRRRVRLVAFLAEVGRDPRIRQEAAGRGRAYAGLSAEPSISPDLAGLAVRVAVEDGGPATYDAVLARLEGSGAEQRANLIYALATADSPSLSGRAGSLWRDPRLKPTERLFPALLDDDRGVMRRTYDQMSTAIDAMVAAVPPFHESQLALAAREICDSGAELAKARDLLADVVQRYPSMRTTAARALEHAEVCAAEREAERGAARAWFAAQLP